MGPLAIAIADLLLWMLFLCCGIHGQPMFPCDSRIPNAANYPFCRTTLPIKDRVNDLIGRLTLKEKAQHLVSRSGAVSRLGIPVYEWWSEALHGVSNVGPGTHFDPRSVPAATSFPQVILTAASFNTALWEAIGQAMKHFSFPIYFQCLGYLNISPYLLLFFLFEIQFCIWSCNLLQK